MIIGTYSGGSASANEYSTFPELLEQLPDNSGNLIDAVNVRNSVYTLWERISYVQTVASQSASASVVYTNTTPTLIDIGGILAGSTFAAKTMTEMWDALLYPYVSPSPSLSATIPSGQLQIEFGGSNVVTLNWSASKVAWRSAVYWGKTPTFALPSMSIVGSQPAWADGAGLSGAGKVLLTTRAANYSGINGAGQYLVFAWPTSYGTPAFTVNGLPNTAFTKIGNAVSHTNMHGYTVSYDVWISNTAQNSPIASFIIS